LAILGNLELELREVDKNTWLWQAAGSNLNTSAQTVVDSFYTINGQGTIWAYPFVTITIPDSTRAQYRVLAPSDVGAVYQVVSGQAFGN